MVDHNGFSILDHQQVGDIVTMDASLQGEVGGLPGIAAFNFETNEYFHRPVPEWLLGLHIADYELIVHLVVARVWGPSWGGKEIQGYTDNDASYYLLRNGRSDSGFRLAVARQFWYLETKFDFIWCPQKIDTKSNEHSGSLSRWGDAKQRERFYKLIGSTNARQIQIYDKYFVIDRNL